MEKPLLNNPEIFPTSEVLKETLGKSYAAFEQLSALLIEQGVALDWKYYNDGKAWLCKVSYKKKTIFWLSAWNGYFMTSFYFLERHLEGIMALEIDNSHYTLEKEWGKMIPLLFNISKSEQLPDLLKMVEYKKKAK
ncbi:MAG: DUF3788 domain-containing protein [Prevotellaceae bacterium]|jgi:hypothetical protein|nr:DUF3788 domain-containing protein [Prevotellaceae bacterium]